jgi:hypothetical protein
MFSAGMMLVDGIDGYLASRTQSQAITGKRRALRASRALGIFVVVFSFGLGGAELLRFDVDRIALPLGSHHRSSETTWVGIAVTTSAVIFMPLLSRAKRKVGRALNSTAMMTDAKQTDFCMYQAIIVIFGLEVHATLGIACADSAAALLLVPLLLQTGTLSIRGQACCAHHHHHHWQTLLAIQPDWCPLSHRFKDFP